VSADGAKTTRYQLPRWLPWAIGGAVAGLLVIAAAVALAATSRPAYFSRYHSLQRSYTELQTSAHKGMSCDQCHVDPRGVLVADATRVGDFYAGLFKSPAAPRFVRLPSPSKAACLGCHRYDWSDDSSRTMKVPHPAHLRVASETRDCVTCHRWIGHEETYMQQHTTMPFSVVCASFECHVGVKKSTDCRSCHHVLQTSLGEWKKVHPEIVRQNGANGCLEKCHTIDQCQLCHTTGKMPSFPATIAASTVKAIERQHVQPDWLDKHGALALADKSKCLTCHISEGECQDCHSKRPAFHGSQATWLGEHQPLAKKNPQRCLTCHQQTWCDECHKQFKEMR